MAIKAFASVQQADERRISYSGISSCSLNAANLHNSIPSFLDRLRFCDMFRKEDQSMYVRSIYLHGKP